MTDPAGTTFLSYRRTRAAEAKLLVEALHDRGIPTWQDISDLPTTPTEEELRRVLNDPATSSGILFVTPEVEQSAVIRTIEAPGIVNRHLRGDGFFAVPIAAGGLAYSDFPRVVGPHIGLAHLPGWNIHRPGVDPIGDAEAADIARLVLRQRLAALDARLPPGEPLRVAMGTRAAPPKGRGHALTLDLTHRFEGRLAKAGSWENHILPALSDVADAIRAHAPQREVELSGLIALPAAVAIGSAFLAQSGVRAAWAQDQQAFSKPTEFWSLSATRVPSGFETSMTSREPSAPDIALLVSVTADVVPDFAVVVPWMPPLCAVVSVKHPPGQQRVVLDAGQALDVANLAIDALRSARTKYQCRGTVHLFLAVPAGVAVLIGQLLNTFGQVQTYEHTPGEAMPYVSAALLRPSG